MFFKSMLVFLALVVVIFCFDVLLPKFIKRYKRYRELEKQKKRRESFKNKMKELEIK